MMAGGAFKQTLVSPPLRRAILLGVDLGRNLAVTGSLSTIWWLIAIRRDGEGVRARDFFKVGLVAMPFAMLLAIAALFVTLNNQIGRGLAKFTECSGFDLIQFFKIRPQAFKNWGS